MRDQALSGTVAAHRSVLILGTALLAVGTSQLADSRGTVPSWLLTLGGAALMYCGDQLQEVERTSAELSRTAQRPANETRVDVFTSRRPILICVLLLGGIVLSVAGLVL